MFIKSSEYALIVCNSETGNYVRESEQQAYATVADFCDGMDFEGCFKVQVTDFDQENWDATEDVIKHLVDEHFMGGTNGYLPEFVRQSDYFQQEQECEKAHAADYGEYVRQASSLELAGRV